MKPGSDVTVKYLVVGDSGVGKTSLLVRYCDESFQTQYLSTIGVDFKIKRIQIDGNLVTLNIWDTAGQQRFRNITKSFYKGAHAIVLTYSITDPQSFSHIQEWINQIHEAGNSQIEMILVASKSDMQQQRKVSYKEGQQLADKYKIHFIETSAKNNSNIQKVFMMLSKDILQKQYSGTKQTRESIILDTNTETVKQKDDKCC